MCGWGLQGLAPDQSTIVITNVTIRNRRMMLQFPHSPTLSQLDLNNVSTKCQENVWKNVWKI